VEELSARLGRSKEELLKRGLSASDFNLNEELNITFHDGSTAYFRYAFFIAAKLAEVLLSLRNTAGIICSPTLAPRSSASFVIHLSLNDLQEQWTIQRRYMRC
jgi:hypothetical protein